MQTQLEHTLEEFPRLAEIASFAKGLYDSAGLLVHNYDHASWVTERIIEIAVAEHLPADTMEDAIIAGLMHDVGVSQEPYYKHGHNGAMIAYQKLPEYGVTQERAASISIAIREHGEEAHVNDVAKILHDADTLNKAGEHGIRQCMLVGIEFAFDINHDLRGMQKRFSPMYDSLIALGYYFDHAGEIDRQMGNHEYSGLRYAQHFWQVVFDKDLKSYVNHCDAIRNALRSVNHCDAIRNALRSCRCPNEQP